MNSKFVLLCTIPLLLLAGCGTSNNTSSSPLESSSSSASTSKETSITKGLKKLKKGFRAKMTYIASNSSSSTNVAREVVLLSNSHNNFYATRDLAFDSKQEVVDNDSKFDYYSLDDKGLLYKESLNSKNKVISDYRFNNNAYFDSVYSNPFETLDENNITINADGDYDVPVSFTRYLVSFFGLDVSSFQDRELDHSTISFFGDEVSKIELLYKAKDTYVFSFTLEIEESGDFDFAQRQPIEDDGTDKSKLESAFKKLESNNYTMSFSITGGAMNLITNRKWKLYFDGEKIFVDQDLYYTIPGLSVGDYLLKKDTKQVFSAYTYQSDISAFKKAQERVSYEDELLDSSPSMNFFTKNKDSTYSVPSSLAYCLMDYLEPKIARSNAYTLGAKSISITIDSHGLPVITSQFDYSTGLTDTGTIVTSFSKVNETTLPDYVSNASSID